VVPVRGDAVTAILDQQVSQPGVYDIPADAYHRDPVEGGSLSSSGARKLLSPHCPARFRWERDHPPETTKAFDFGHAAHQLTLGAGPDVVVVAARDWRTKAAQEQRDEAHRAGKVPLLEDDWGRVVDMAKALRAHPYASALFNGGKPEQTLVWRDQKTGVICRAMLDWLPSAIPGRRMIVPDYKTAVSAEPAVFARAAVAYGYCQQDAWYLDGVTALGLAVDPAFVFVVQEKDPPHLVSVVELDAEFRAMGRERNARAREVYRDCVASGIWPSYTTDIELVAAPRWALRQHEESYLD
jgi:hypothetical protein